jgi:hypothetical protein
MRQKSTRDSDDAPIFDIWLEILIHDLITIIAKIKYRESKNKTRNNQKAEPDMSEK